MWNLKTFILRGENDTLCEYDYVKTFVDNFSCELTEQKGGKVLKWLPAFFNSSKSERERPGTMRGSAGFAVCILQRLLQRPHFCYEGQFVIVAEFLFK